MKHTSSALSNWLQLCCLSVLVPGELSRWRRGRWSSNWWHRKSKWICNRSSGASGLCVAFPASPSVHCRCCLSYMQKLRFYEPLKWSDISMWCFFALFNLYKCNLRDSALLLPSYQNVERAFLFYWQSLVWVHCVFSCIGSELWYWCEPRVLYHCRSTLQYSALWKSSPSSVSLHCEWRKQCQL